MLQTNTFIVVQQTRISIVLSPCWDTDYLYSPLLHGMMIINTKVIHQGKPHFAWVWKLIISM